MGNSFSWTGLSVRTKALYFSAEWFTGTFKRSYDKYFKMLQELKGLGLIECDIFLLLVADYKVICERNLTRSHVLDGIWTEESLIKAQREVLEKMFGKLVGKISLNTVEKRKIDTTQLSKEEVLQKVINTINHIKINDNKEIYSRR